VHQGKAHLIRKRENFEDILRNQVEIDFESINAAKVTEKA
jgi:diaminopimelate decarboxylase